MQVTINDTKEATCKFFAIQDRQFRNAVNASLYTDKEKTRALGMKHALELVYTSKGVHVNYNKTGITIKVDGAIVVDKKGLKMLEQDWAGRGITKKLTAQGVIYAM